MIPPAARQALESALGERVTFDAPMSRYTSLRIGGPADALARPADRNELAALLQLCAQHQLPHQVTGSGFNTLVRDGGLEGVTIQLAKLRALDERPGGAVRAGPASPTASSPASARSAASPASSLAPASREPSAAGSP